MFVLKDRHSFVLILVSWLTEKVVMIYCFISGSFSSGIIKCYMSWAICKIATVMGILEKLVIFETQIATFVGISKKLPLFY